MKTDTEIRHEGFSILFEYMDVVEDVAVYSITPVELIGGTLPKRQRRFVEAWAELHQEELLNDWNLLQSGRLPSKIEPLH